MKILLVDDERLLVKGLQHSLEAEGYQVLTAGDGLAALEVAARTAVDLIILDLMLPQLNGLEVCRRVRQFSTVPIIMLTAKGDDVDKVVGLELGADDYLAKPFNTRELIARIKAVSRRSGVSGPAYGSTDPLPAHPDTHAAQTDQPQLLRYDCLAIDLDRHQVWAHGCAVELTVREYELLTTLARHPGRIYTREMLMDLVWGSRYYGEPRVVDVYVRRLRQKLEADPGKPRWIITRWGTGYYFQE